MGVKFNAKQFEREFVKEANEKGRAELLSRLPDDLRAKLLASGTIVTLDAMAGKLRLSGGDEVINAEAIAFWEKN